jgi:4-hydroxythreonine-4-phosphate dehydrogenase
MGCPVGVGPEIIIKYFSSQRKCGKYFPIVIGLFELFAKIAKDLGAEVELINWQPGDPVTDRGLYIYQPQLLVEGDSLDISSLSWGEPSEHTGRAMAICIESCVELIKGGVLAAMVTCPITKSALQKAGYDYPGHTEMLAKLCEAPDYAMMMAGQKLRVTLVTIHVGLTDVPKLLTKSSILNLLEITGTSLKDDFHIQHPRMAVAGLNPHAGEDGLFGNEEADLIQPAVEIARESGWDVSGPFPPDTVFNKAVSGDFDAVVCMYHDQGLIPFKLLHFEDGVNVTLGLPIVRTSVDHGTAYDIAGKGIASYASLAAAYEMAVEIVENRSQNRGE